MGAAKKLIDNIKKDIAGGSIKLSPTYLSLVKVFPLQPIRNRKQHEQSLKIVEKLIDFCNNNKGTDKGAELYLKMLSELVSNYELSLYAAPLVSGTEMLEYLMELKGLTQKDIAKDLGGQSVVSNLLNSKRELNLRQVRTLASRFKVSPKVFI
jgi:HTH-type transcriptional regulator/antitoxin HigA